MSIGATVTGNPAPEVTWTFAGQNVMKYNNIKTSKTSKLKDHYKMSMENTDVRQMGTYTLTAKIHDSVVEKSFTLKVLGK